MPRRPNPLFAESIRNMSEDQLWEHYEKMLKTHDWHYGRSDDSQVYRVGSAERDTINSIRTVLRSIDSLRTEQLFKQYAPSGM